MLIFGMGGCAIMDSPKYRLSDGHYKSSAFNAQSKKVYIDNTEDTIFVYSVNKHPGLQDTVTGRNLSRKPVPGQALSLHILG